MAVKLRLTRMGRKKRPFYRIVAIDSRKRRDGAYLDKIGHYDPLTRPATLVIDHDVALKWLNEGATPSDTVKNLFRRDGVMLRWDMSKRDYDQAKIEEAVKAHRARREEQALTKESPEPVKQQAKVKPEPKAEEPKEEAKPKAKAEDAEPKEEAKAEAKAEEPKAEEKAEKKAEASTAAEADKADEAAEAKEAAPAEEPTAKDDSKKE